MAKPSILDRYARAVRKREKWARRAESLEARLRLDKAGEHAPISNEGTQRKSPSSETPLIQLKNSSKSEGSRLSDAVLADFGRGKKYYGVWNRVARKYGVSSSLPAMVSKGKGSSSRIYKAVLEEIQLVDEELRTSPLPVYTDAELKPLTVHERAQFQGNGRYYGIMSSVSRTTGISIGNCSRVANGDRSTPHILAALRREMALIDAEIAAKDGGANG